MKIIGIICELNPLHCGHKYLIDQARQRLGADYVVLVMSGDFTQRGTPAIVSKEIRTKMALCSGADAVFELPLLYATGSAEFFASGAISLLNSLGCIDELLFGSEYGNADLLLKTAQILNDEPESFKEILQQGLRSGQSFALARDNALKEYLSEIQTKEPASGNDLKKAILSGSLLASPNNILGIEYCRALLSSKSSIRPVSITRIGSGYHEEELSGSYASAAAIRKELLSSIEPSDQVYDRLSSSVPKEALRLLLAQDKYICLDDYSPYLHYRLLSEASSSFTEYADIHTDLSDKIIKYLPQFTSVTSFADLLKSKDLTYTRIQRSLLHILLGIKESDQMHAKERKYPVYARLLGFRKDASPLLARIAGKEKGTAGASIPVISRLSDADRLLDPQAKALLRQSIAASGIYHLQCPEKLSEYQKRLVIL